ncbi:hypothetical protein Sgly_1146 [Syntrophobotulus glycolicus DSM 8271]|uniref:Lipoprotein n=1 Tax=Syntrophobotulus glycolicus (strain DSM 8271 / FlGlyR) TaxID=645991 RepID=F0SU85_SYNGF|nr:hypothetical protein [Syntrophobotulus glycolicus]ADY55468.1 hypothetical protein Sgly_1146 [Syntrophobotulus glycolicus DSM 8271]
MKRLFTVLLLTGSLLISGCSNPLLNTASDTQEPLAEPSENESTVVDTDQSPAFLGNKPFTKKTTPKTSPQGYSLENIAYPQLSDESSSYVTKRFPDLDGLFKDNQWSPLCFIDNDTFVFSAVQLQGAEEKVYKYNMKSKTLKELFQVSCTGRPSFFIQSSTSFYLCYDNMAVLIDNDKVSKKILLSSFQQEYKDLDIPQFAVNPEAGKVLLLDYDKKRGYLADLNMQQITELPVQGVVTGGWLDAKNVLLGTVDKIDERRRFEGSAVVKYNIESKSSTKTYLGTKSGIPAVFGGLYRNSNEYCGFNYLAENIPPSGLVGIIDQIHSKMIFLELENAVGNLTLYHNKVITVIANKPVDWEVWGRAEDDQVYLVVYDVDTENYSIRAKNLPKPPMYLPDLIISPDARTMIYHAEAMSYINRPK